MDKKQLQERVAKVRNAFDENNIISIEFYQDGSGVNFTFYYHNECFNRKESQSMSLPMYAAIMVLSGYRCKQHESKTCF